MPITFAEKKMDYITLARVIHVLAVIVWIGGVAMVTTVIIPAIKKMASPEEQIQTFEQIEGRFAWQARGATLLAGGSGFYMLYALQAWERYFSAIFWYLHAMTLIWFIFSLILYVLEPFVLHKIFRKYTERNPAKAFRIMHIAHWILLLLSLLTTAGAVAGSHGWFWL